MQQTMRDAMQVMRSGDLNRATELIQRGLANAPAPDGKGAASPHATPRATPHPPIHASAPCIDGTWRVVPDAPDDVIHEPPASPAKSNDDPPVPEIAKFECAAGAREYVVYAPRQRGLRSPPVLLMLHGCTQDAADFARGTRMHVQAVAAGWVVVYPTQSPGANPNGCWNWFRPGDQQRDRGEPAILAGLASAMKRRFQSEPGPAFVAGLSAGGAMAVTMGRLYPELFRGVGVHSGLPHGCARDVPSALAAMRSAGKAARPIDGNGTNRVRVPTIVFHGDCDRTVDICNAGLVVADATRLPPLASEDASDGCAEISASGSVDGGHRYTTTVFRDRSGNVLAERWIVHGAGHAWFGGSREGTYTDPAGPDATAEMLRFFRALS